MGQQKRSKRTAWIAIDKFWSQIRAIFSFWQSLDNMDLLELFEAHLGGTQ